MKTPLKEKKLPAKQVFNSDKANRKKYFSVLVFGVLIVISFIYYGNTLSLKYALDDTIVITGNSFTKQGFKGIGDILTYDLFAGYFGKDQNMVAGGRYRPLSLISFAIEYQFFGENPKVSHLINVLLLALTAFAIYLFFRNLLKDKSNPYTGIASKWFTVPLLTAVFFIAHPIHTEVVANIKGRDEIFSLLFSIAAANLSLHFYRTKNLIHAVLSGILFFMGLISKENTLTFLAVIPLAFYFFSDFNRNAALKAMIPLFISTIIFFIIRQSIIGGKVSPLADDLMNNPFVEMNILQKYSTIFYTLGLYLKLMFFPHPLTYDYYPYHIPIVNPNEIKALLPLFLYLSMGIFSLIFFRKKNPYAFGILFFLSTLSITSNFFFPIGVFMNERFAFMSSLGFCLVMAWFLAYDFPSLFKRTLPLKYISLAFVFILLFLAGAKTISRNNDWYDSSSLFLNDVKVSANSAKGNALAGEYLIYEAQKTENTKLRDSLLLKSIDYGQKAISIYPKQIIALMNLAAAYYEYNRNYDSIISIYKKVLIYLPNEEKVYQNFNAIMRQLDNTDLKIGYYQQLLAVNSERFDINITLGNLLLNGRKDFVAAIPYLEKAVLLNSSDFDALNNLGVAYAYSKTWNKALEYFQRAEKIKPQEVTLLNNIAVCYSQTGNQGMAAKYLERANAIKSDQNRAR